MKLTLKALASFIAGYLVGYFAVVIGFWIASLL